MAFPSLYICHAEECIYVQKFFSSFFFLILPVISRPDSVIYCLLLSKIDFQF